ncbi:hypothetical protein Tco_1132163 [Tanacetum coccineum]|uniref:CCHC-type domain-containing protein n=1 Tax=Tanacetum coccineum TaxID=301880 RepID=A0ABQ5JDX2_9ASTR
MSDMTACLNDLSYIPLNNEQHEPKLKRDMDPVDATPDDVEMEDFVPSIGFCLQKTRNIEWRWLLDGFNHSGNLRKSYSMWPVILTTYNLPPWLCIKESSFMLTLLIPGPKSPGKDIDVYLRSLIDELKDLWANPGVETIDVATGLKACPMCNEDTPSVHVLGKTAYVGHRRFLKKPYKWRRSLEFNGETKNGDPHREFNGMQLCLNLLDCPRLEYWYFLTLKHNLDVMHIEKNVLESILITLLMNDKSKDTCQGSRKSKTRLERLVHSNLAFLWLGQNNYRKCSKPQAAYSFKPEDRKKFCQFIKGVKLPDGFESNFKHKVTDNDTNIIGLKSHDCHIMMQRLLPYGLQQYLPPDVAKPLIELCLFFKQICSQTLMVDDMLKAQSKVIDILCNLELIYPPAFFDIMIHLVIHLPLEAIFGGPIRPRWMYPFERYMKKLKNYVRNKAKPEGSIAEGYVAEEALTFSSHYFRDVTTKFNRPDRNVDCPPPTCQFQVFKSLCKSIGLRSVIRIDHQELKKVIWYVLHNSPEIDTYRAKFKIEFPNKDMKEEFPGWFGKQTPISVNSCVVNGVRFVVHSRDELRTTQNSGICLPGPDGEMYYGQLEQILEFSYLSFKTVLFRANGEAFKNDQCILTTQVKQCFYLEDMARRPLGWKVVKHVSHKKFSNGGVIVVEDDPDVIHVDNSSDLALSTNDDIIDEEDPIPHDLADSDDEDLVNLDIDDGVNVMSADVARGHGGDSGGDDRPPPYQIPTGCGGCLGNRGKGTQFGWQESGQAAYPPRDSKPREVVVALPFLAPNAAGAKGEGRGKDWGKPNLTFVPTWNSIAGNIMAGHPCRHLQKIYNGKKAALKERHWVPDEDGTYDVERIRRRSPSHIFEIESSSTREYPSLIHTFFLTHTVGGVFLNPEDKALYDGMLRLQGLGSNTSTSVPYTEDKIMAIVHEGTFSVLVGFYRDRARSFRPRLHARTPPIFAALSHRLSTGGGNGVAGARMISQEMMTTVARMMRMRRMPIFATNEINNVKAGEGTSNGRGGGSSQYGRLTKLELPKFNGEDVQVSEDPMVELKNLRQTTSVQGMEEDEDMQLTEEGVMSTFTTSLIDEPPLISLNALFGENSYRTTRVRAYVRKNVVHTLIDCGSTHNFLDWNTSRNLGCKLRKICPSKVSVANGHVMNSLYECKDFTWELQGITYTSDVMILPLRGCGMYSEELSKLQYSGCKMEAENSHSKEVETVLEEFKNFGGWDDKKQSKSLLITHSNGEKEGWYLEDVCGLHMLTLKDKFPIPIVEELIDELSGSKFFTKLDLRSGIIRLEWKKLGIPFGTLRWEASIKVEILDFSRTLKAKEFVDWLNTVERVFEFKDAPENRKVKWVVIKLKGRASAWWEKLQLMRERTGKQKNISEVFQRDLAVEKQQTRSGNRTGASQSKFVGAKQTEHGAKSQEPGVSLSKRPSVVRGSEAGKITGSSSQTFNCFKCGEPGHWSSDCRKERGKQLMMENEKSQTYEYEDEVEYTLEPRYDEDEKAMKRIWYDHEEVLRVTGDRKKDKNANCIDAAEDAFSSTNTPHYIPTSPSYFLVLPGNTSPDSSDDLTKDLLSSLSISPFHDDPYMKIIQAYDAISPPQAIIALLAILPPYLVFTITNVFFPLKEISSPKDIETPIESPILVSPSSLVGSSSPVRSTTPPPGYSINKLSNSVKISLWIISRPLKSEPVPKEPNESNAC